MRATKGMSSWGQDYRRQYMDKYHKKPFDERTLAIFKRGTQIHEYYQSQLKEKERIEYHRLFPFTDFIVIAHEHPVYKVIDGELFTSNIDTLLLKDKQFILIDYKSTNTLPTKPKLPNVVQLSVYADCFPLPSEEYTMVLWLCYIDADNHDDNKWMKITPINVDYIYEQQRALLNQITPTTYCKNWCPCRHMKDCGLYHTGVIENKEIVDGKNGPYNTVFLDNGDVIHGRFKCTEGEKIGYGYAPKTFHWCFEIDHLGEQE